jgi:hypothetical protein
VFVDVRDNRTDDKTRHGTAGIQQTDTQATGVTQVLVPGVEGLKAGHETAIVCDDELSSAYGGEVRTTVENHANEYDAQEAARLS